LLAGGATEKLAKPRARSCAGQGIARQRSGQVEIDGGVETLALDGPVAFQAKFWFAEWQSPQLWQRKLYQLLTKRLRPLTAPMYFGLTGWAPIDLCRDDNCTETALNLKLRHLKQAAFGAPVMQTKYHFIGSELNFGAIRVPWNISID
jgi:hypothetical protein